LRALVIDDDELVRETIVAILKSINLDVVAACDGEEGLQLFEADPTDLVITDILMPNKEGRPSPSYARRIRMLRFSLFPAAARWPDRNTSSWRRGWVRTAPCLSLSRLSRS